ncbi:nucleotide exchange factor GrpE [Lysinibacillus sp. FSL H8-0500]|uniref:Nucleotide exchange factor GrpE n=1 Tax=Lysinibacillus macroides TaxID=33935 RepID=A0A0M9DEL8_9BACI|nr:nucleotide exchange factor GrpE [Lysinibacillus macroides]KOY79898.1 hypothetical protein ADM90_22010 [Lysinibacillus macroides]QPR67148.1 nucleotide exchange factor GrpE [Lysinibacillus macroides]
MRIYHDQPNWESNLDSIARKLLAILPTHYFKEEVIYVEIKSHIEQLLKENLSNLEEMVEKFEDFDVPEEQPLEVLIEQINTQVKKGTKVNMKMFEELRQFLDTRLDIQEDPDMVATIEAFEQERASYIHVMIKGIDSMDLIHRAASLSEKVDKDWVAETDKIISEHLNNLAQLGIVEIPVKGKILDGAYMESIGVVTTDNQVPLYTVVDVLERCFMDQKTTKIVRIAKVINVG